MGPRVRSHGMKADPPGYLWSKYECFLMSWLVVLRLNVPVNNFQSCRDGAIASWVINQYFRGVKCLAEGHNTAEVGLEPRTSRSGVRHSTTEPPRSPFSDEWLVRCMPLELLDHKTLKLFHEWDGSRNKQTNKQTNKRKHERTNGR